MNILLKKKNFYLFILFYSLLAIFFALYIEYILGYEACKLCLYQRIPFLVAIFVSFIGYNYSKNDKILIFIIIIFSIILSIILILFAYLVYKFLINFIS